MTREILVAIPLLIVAAEVFTIGRQWLFMRSVPRISCAQHLDSYKGIARLDMYFVLLLTPVFLLGAVVAAFSGIVGPLAFAPLYFSPVVVARTIGESVQSRFFVHLVADELEEERDQVVSSWRGNLLPDF